jgi:hypothetical protein
MSAVVEAFADRLREARDNWMTLKAQLAVMDTRMEREDAVDAGFRHLRSLRKLLKDMGAEASTAGVGDLKLEASALFGEAEATLTHDN